MSDVILCTFHGRFWLFGKLVWRGQGMKEVGHAEMDGVHMRADDSWEQGGGRGRG